jgi:hypothetical protein
MAEVKSGLFEILSKVKARPGLYIGRPSLSDLFMFLVGYKTARRELGIELTGEEIRFYQDFHAFVEKKYNLHTANTWAKIILLYCSDEQQGFDRFFELLAEFEQLQSKEIQSDGFVGKESTLSLTS